MSDIDEPLSQSSEAPQSGRVGVGLVAIALALPVLAGVALLFVTSFGPALAISATTVLVSSILVAIDANRLGKTDLMGRQRESAGLLFLGMCCLWILVYPSAFFRRRHFDGPNLALPAILVALFFVVGPILRWAFIPLQWGFVTPGLPACTSQEVVQLLDQVIHATPVGAKAKSIDGHREVSYDRAADRRHGQCVMHTEGADTVINYIVQWRDRSKFLFEVRIPPPDLPECTSREVVQLLEQVIRGTPVGAKTKSIDGHHEVSYDRTVDRRHGQCVVHTDGADIVVNFDVQWRDRDKGYFEVRIPPPDLPECTSREVVQLLEQVIRGAPIGAKAKSIDGHREISYDRVADRRQGQCVVHTDGADIVVNYSVQWRDRDKGHFEIRISQ